MALAPELETLPSFHDDFDTLSGWTTAGGTWSSDGDRLRKTAHTSQNLDHIYRADISETDCEIIAKLEGGGHTSDDIFAGIFLHKTNNSWVRACIARTKMDIATWNGSSLTQLAVGGSGYLNTDTFPVWIKLVKTGNVLALTRHLVDPLMGGPQTHLLQVTLLGGNATEWGAGVSLNPGLGCAYLNGAGQGFDDFVVV
jgi:hypothetical protein